LLSNGSTFTGYTLAGGVNRAGGGKPGIPPSRAPAKKPAANGGKGDWVDIVPPPKVGGLYTSRIQLTHSA
jgi:hypothetical protein